MTDLPANDNDVSVAEQLSPSAPMNIVSTETASTNPETRTPESAMQNKKSRKTSTLLMVIFFIVLIIAMILVLVLVYTTEKHKKDVTAALKSKTQNSSVKTNLPEANYILAYTRNTNEDAGVFGKMEISFYDMSKQTEVYPSGDYMCQDDNCSAHLYDWSPDGNILPLLISEYDQEVKRFVYYDKSKNTVFPLTTLDKESGHYGDSGLQESIVWKSESVFQIGTFSFDIVKKRVDKAGRVGPEFSEDDTTKTSLLSDSANKNVLYKQIVEDTGVEKFHGFFALNTIHEARYEILVDGREFLQTRDFPQGHWNIAIVLFTPSDFADVFEVIAELGGFEGQPGIDDVERDKMMLDKLGPRSDAKITLHPIGSSSDKQTITVPSNSAWISFGVKPIQGSDRLIVFQSEFVQIPYGKTRISMIDIKNSSEIRVIKELDISGMEFAFNPYGYNNTTADGKYLLITTSSDDEGAPPKDLNKIEVLDLDTGGSTIVCESKCEQAILYDPYKIRLMHSIYKSD